MKKRTKNILVILGVILLLVILDAGQALFFSRSPIIRYHYVVSGNTDVKVIDKGLLVDTYHCNNGNVVSVFKGFSYSCITDKPSYTIEDTSKKEPDFACDLALEEIYDDGEDTYYLPCIKSHKIIVTYVDGKKEDVKTALANGNIVITDLDKFNITYLIQ